jgi:hypothetical protein
MNSIALHRRTYVNEYNMQGRRKHFGSGEAIPARGQLYYMCRGLCSHHMEIYVLNFGKTNNLKPHLSTKVFIYVLINVEVPNSTCSDQE